MTLCFSMQLSRHSPEWMMSLALYFNFRLPHASMNESSSTQPSMYVRFLIFFRWNVTDIGVPGLHATRVPARDGRTESREQAAAGTYLRDDTFYVFEI